MPPITGKPAAPTLAINLFDLDTIYPALRIKIFSKRIDPANPIVIDGNADETAIPFVCDTLTAASICELVRANAKAMGTKIPRVYAAKKEKWVRLSDSTSLTLTFCDMIFVHPKLFELEIRINPPAPKKVQLGRKGI